MASYFELKRTHSQFSAADRDDLLRRLAGNVSAMQQRWPRKVDFSGLLPNCALAIFPLLFIDAFGQVDEERLLHFLSGCKLLAGGLMIADPLFDEDLDREEHTARLLRWHGLQFELGREFALTFTPESMFWQSLREALAEHLGGIAKESIYTARRRRLIDAPESECIAIALAKSCVSRVAIVGLSLLGDDVSRADALVQSIEKQNLARQIVDDLQDWKADVRANRPTLVTVRLAAALGVSDTAAPAFDTAALARELYYGGHAEELLALARANVAAALDAADRERRLPWHTLLEVLDRSVAGLQRDVIAIVRRNLGRRSGDAVSA